jgi:hypothetical protein
VTANLAFIARCALVAVTRHRCRILDGDQLKAQRMSRSISLSAAEKSTVTAACQHLIDDFLKPRFQPTIQPTQFNYPVDILGKWHGNKYRFIQRYRSGFPDNFGEEFDAPFARLDWISSNRFDIQWHRHTGEWFCLHRGLTLAEAIDTLRSDGLLHPP